MLRNAWLGGLAFTLLFTAVAALSGASGLDLFFTFVVYGTFAAVTVRFGLLALASLIVVDGMLGDMQASFDASAWYYPYFVVILLAVAAIILWVFRQSILGRAALSPDYRR